MRIRKLLPAFVTRHFPTREEVAEAVAFCLRMGGYRLLDYDRSGVLVVAVPANPLNGQVVITQSGLRITVTTNTDHGFNGPGRLKAIQGHFKEYFLWAPLVKVIDDPQVVMLPTEPTEAP
ncbi:MAG: hypothetical protein JWN01_937 [Patescibacteria group bacterium]|nr:hypothetical protein [Patescibacteria group bacterium]